MLSKFKIITDEISKATGIDKDLFLFKLDKEKLTHQNDSMIEYDKHFIFNHTFLEYQYRENIKHQWRSITFRISKEVIEEFIRFINLILKKINEREINIESFSKEFKYIENNFPYFFGYKKGEDYFVNFAEKQIN
jgi:hypothetical protein